MNPGCGACSCEDAEAAWRHFADGVDSDASIVDGPHFIVPIVRCHACSQRFIRIFTEFIDWPSGQARRVTRAAATFLVSEGGLYPAA